MSAMTQLPTAASEPTSARRPGSLFRAELHRFAARRFIQVLVGLSVVGWLAAVGIGLLVFDEPSAADYAVAQERLEQFLADEEQWRSECVEDAEDAGEDVESFCGPPLTAADMGGVEGFLDRPPFVLASAGEGGAIAFAAGAAVLTFLVGATWIGAEWSHRTIVALLFWVPSRLRVMGTKLGVLALASAALGVVAQLGWLAMAGILQAVAGVDGDLPAGFWGDLLAAQGRSVLLAVLAGLIGFGLANLLRNTGAALGAGFVYFAIVELAVRLIDPTLERWLLSVNAVALVVPGGVTLYDYSAMVDGTGEPPTYLVTNLQGGLVVGAFAAVIVGVGGWLFARRDLH
jgi:ABC-type transport system involved in multi-copper enzyme maturation permease subunit